MSYCGRNLQSKFVVVLLEVKFVLMKGAVSRLSSLLG